MPPGLELVPPTATLAEQVLTWRHHPEVMRWFLMLREDPAEMVASWAAYDPRERHRVVAVLEGVAVVLGSVRVAYGMGQSGHEEALDAAFGRLALRRVQAGCFADNTASWRVMEKLGMRREQYGVRDSFHAELGWIDGYTYAVLAEEWTLSR